ncbi:MAG: FadR family transcriptional regulator [Dethiobacter sp.]|jgi:GntR family transcriptional repressor for pyruvate dehydrogenase complex|nr:MAG: FadR family transcriptional regulator [Dethiobacter sp.]
MIKKVKPPFKPFKKTYAHNYVSELLKEYIVSGVYNAGDQLPSEIDLCQDLGVSRSAVREGLRELEGAGLIKTVQGSKGGRFVNKINSDIIVHGLDLILKSRNASFEQLMEARKIIECVTAQMAALNRTEEHLEAMLKIVDLRTKSKEEFYKKNYELHEIVALSSQNMVLFYIVQALRKLIFRTYSFITMEEIDIERAIECHYAIYKAIKNRDPEEAEKAMISDLEAYRKLYLEIIRKRLEKKGNKL